MASLTPTFADIERERLPSAWSMTSIQSDRLDHEAQCSATHEMASDFHGTNFLRRLCMRSREYIKTCTGGLQKS